MGAGEAEGSIVVVMKDGTKVFEFPELVTLKSVYKTFVPVLPKQTHDVSKKSIPLSIPNWKSRGFLSQVAAAGSALYSMPT